MAITVRIDRSELVALAACKEGLAFFDTLAVDGVFVCDWSPLSQCWLAVDARSWVGWARDKNILPANDLRDANLRDANLYGVLVSTTYTPPAGWINQNGVIVRA